MRLLEKMHSADHYVGRTRLVKPGKTGWSVCGEHMNIVLFYAQTYFNRTNNFKQT